jgi:polysaccharide export outer membrane protein
VRVALIAVCGLAALPACALFRGPPREDPPTLPPSPVVPAAPGTTLGPGDVFEVRVFQEPDLSGIYRVAAEGGIDFPLCGKIAIAGLTPNEASGALTRCLSGRYLKNPQVSIFLKEYNSKKVFVFGQVQKPGTFVYEEGMTIVQAVTLAGGFFDRPDGFKADKNSVNVTRVVEGVEQRIKVRVEDIAMGRAPNFTLLPGDIIFVPEGWN